MQTLFQDVAKQHGVDVAVVHQYTRRRDLVADGAVIFSFGILYVFGAYILLDASVDDFATTTRASG